MLHAILSICMKIKRYWRPVLFVTCKQTRVWCERDTRHVLNYSHMYGYVMGSRCKGAVLDGTGDLGL